MISEQREIQSLDFLFLFGQAKRKARLKPSAKKKPHSGA
jgi:hypothetical protein